MRTFAASSIAGMPLQRTADGFLAKQVRHRMPTVAEIVAGNRARPVAPCANPEALLAAVERKIAAVRS